jgi:benzoyl-CoA reductase subunit B
MPGPEIVGRAAKAGADLFRDWFAELDETAARGGQAAYVFVMGSLNEVLKTFDLPVVFPEINSLQTAVRRVAHEYLQQAEDYGYSPDICGYVKADVAVQLRGGAHPMGRIPKPSIVVTTNACNTYLKWAEIWERLHHVPVFTIDVPGTRQAGDGRGFESDRRYVEGQLRELIETCARATGRAFDVDRFREVLGHANRMSAAWKRVIELNRSRPSVFNALTDGTVYLGMANGYRGTATGARYFDELLEEMEFKAANGIGTVADEQWRLAFVGVPCYPIFRRFNELFTHWKGAFVNSTYLWFASGGANRGFQYDLARPVESLAEGVLLGVRDAMDSMFHADRALLEMIGEFAVDGVIFHPVKSCRTTSTGMADARRALAQRTDVPSLFLESDMMDRRVVAEAPMKNRVDAFFEGLASRRRQAVAR